MAVTSPMATFRHVLRRPRNRMLALAAGAGIVVVAGWIALRPRTAPALDPNRVAVAPFDVLGSADLALWREGLVDVLSRSLDGAGPLRAVAPSVVVRQWRGRADPASAAALGRATGARTVVFGGLVTAGADSVRLAATVLDAASGAPLGDAELRDAAARIDRLADSLTVAVLRILSRTRAIGVVRGTRLGSRSLPALRAFLQGEQFLRRSEWDSALANHQRAIALDSGFTLAWSHAGLAAGWQHAGTTLAHDYKLRAGALNHGLAPRESLIVQAESLAAVVYDGPAQIAGRWWGYGRRLVGTLDEAVRRYPDDAELWYMLGDARYHAGALAGLERRAALAAFDQAIALDSTFTPSYVHAVGLALGLDGAAAGARYARAFLAAGAMGRHAQSTQQILELVDPATRAAAIGRIADADSELVGSVWESMNHWIDSAETVVVLLRARAAREQTRGKLSNLTAFALPAALAFRGHLKEAHAWAGQNAAVQAQILLLGGLPADSAAALARGWAARPGQGALFAAPLLAARRDTAALATTARTLDSLRRRPLPATAPPIARDFLSYVTAATRAFLALARGDSAEALRLFDARPDSACYGTCRIDDLVHVQLLAARGRLADAATRLERPAAGFAPGLLPVDVLRALERGRVNERLGNRERAIEGYARVVQAWRNPDPELQPFVAEARAALQRLTAEQPEG